MAELASVVLLVGTTKGAFVFRSKDGRRTWQVHGPMLAGWHVGDLYNLDDTGRRLIAATSHAAYGATVRHSDDGGLTWRQSSQSPRFPAGSGRTVESIWRFASHDGLLYAGVADAGLFVSADEGMSWREVAALNEHPTRPYWEPSAGGLCLHSIVIDPVSPQRIWVAISRAGVFATEDAGETWRTSHDGLPAAPAGHPCPEVGRSVKKLAADPSVPGRLFAQTEDGVFRFDNGAWSKASDGLPTGSGFPIAVAHNGDVFVVPLAGEHERYMPGGRFAVYRSRDHGQTWRECRNGLPDAHFVAVLRDGLTTDTLDPVGVYCGTTSGELYAAADGGDSWSALPGRYTRITSIRAVVTSC